MSSELEGLLGAIRERPDDDLPRLALADWCMEQPDPLTQARGEFIQLRCRAAELAPDDPARLALKGRATELRARHEVAWLGPIARKVDGWDFDRGLIVVELREGYHRRVKLEWLTSRPAWFWVVGVKGVLLGRGDVERLVISAGVERLASLDFSDCDVGAAGAQALAASLRLGRLARLSLVYGRIGDEGAEALSRAVALGGLTVLSLFAAGVGPAGARALANSAALPSLASLDLGHNPLGQQGARAIAGCSGLTSLTELSLCGCQITDRGGWSLVHAAALDKLRSLDLRDNALRDQVRDDLREKFGERVRFG